MTHPERASPKASESQDQQSQLNHLTLIVSVAGDYTKAGIDMHPGNTRGLIGRSSRAEQQQRCPDSQQQQAEQQSALR